MITKQKPQASTQEHLNIEDIHDGLVLLKDGGAALVLQTTAVNFGLLSEEEQDATIFAFAGLLNSLNFPIQIVVRSKRLDISSYLNLIDQRIQRQKNEDLKKQMQKYKEFVAQTISENKVLDKRFYLVIPFLPTELGLKAIRGIFKTPKNLPYSREYILEHAKTALFPKKDHMIRQLSRIGLHAQQLNDQQLVELFYDIYNPAQIGMAKLSGLTQEYTSPVLIEPAVAVPASSQVGTIQGTTEHVETPKPQEKIIQPVYQPVKPDSKPILQQPNEPATQPPQVAPQPETQDTNKLASDERNQTVLDNPQNKPGHPIPESTSLPPKLSTNESQQVEEALKKLAEAATRLPSPPPTPDEQEPSGPTGGKNI